MTITARWYITLLHECVFDLWNSAYILVPAVRVVIRGDDWLDLWQEVDGELCEECFSFPLRRVIRIQKGPDHE